MQHELNNFGIIVVTTKDDFIYAKGCCASVKYFMPDVPLCLLVDGEFDLNGLPEVSDTYEDENGYRNLFICNMQNKSIRPVDKLKSNSEYDNTTLRCDLHPRWSYDGSYICIDTITDKKRCMHLYEIK